MSMDVTREEKIELFSDWSDTDGIQIRVIIRDGTVMEIGFKVIDVVRLTEASKGFAEFLLPHSNNLNSLRGLRNQLAELIIRIENELDIARDASR